MSARSLTATLALATLAAVLPAPTALAGGGGGIPCVLIDTNGNGFGDLAHCSVAIGAIGDGMRMRNFTGQRITSLTLTLPAGDRIFSPDVVGGSPINDLNPLVLPFSASVTASTSAAGKQLTLLFGGPDPFASGEHFDFAFDVDTVADDHADIPPSALAGLLVEGTLADGSTFSQLLADPLPIGTISNSVIDPVGLPGNPDPLTRQFDFTGMLIVTEGVPAPAAIGLLLAGLGAAIGLRHFRGRAR